MSKLKNVFCVYEYDLPKTRQSDELRKERANIDYVFDELRRSVDELEDRWVKSRSISQSSVRKGVEHDVKSITSNYDIGSKCSNKT